MKVQIQNRCNVTKQWIMQEYDMDKSAKLSTFDWSENFCLMANIDLNKKKPCGYDFRYVSQKSEQKDKSSGWVYLITINDKIVKIGGTKTSLKARFGSYSAGTRKNRKSGTCSTTNYIVSECFRKVFEQSKDNKIMIYGAPIDTPKVSIQVLGSQVCLSEMKIDLYTEFETRYIQEYIEQFKSSPILSFNKGN